MAKKNEMELLAQSESAPLARNEPMPIGKLLEGIIDRGVTEQNVKAVEALIGLKERMDAKQAEKDFAAAFSALQADLPIITATSTIPNRGKYEKFEDIMRVVKPLCTKHGFSTKFSQESQENRITVTCKVSHIGGHTETNSFAVRVASRGSDQETQADLKAATTAKRLALCHAFNIIIQQDVHMDDSDATIEGDLDSKLSDDQYEHVKQRCEEVGADMVGFLRLFGIAKLSDMPAQDYARALRALDMKEKKNQAERAAKAQA